MTEEEEAAIRQALALLKIISQRSTELRWDVDQEIRDAVFAMQRKVKPLQKPGNHYDGWVVVRRAFQRMTEDELGKISALIVLVGHGRVHIHLEHAVALAHGLIELLGDLA